MTILVMGVNGQLGHDVAAEFLHRGHSVIGSVRAIADKAASNMSSEMQYIALDITDTHSVENVLQTIRPDAVIHCAAWTAVDDAEKTENREIVFAVNAQATADMAKTCRDIDCKLVYISTDYVFDGTGNEPWKADGSLCKPLNVYGRSKLDGEIAVRELLKRYFIIRTSWVFGENGGNFVKTMLRLGKTHSSLRVVNDQIGTPTYTADLARLIADMTETEKYGTYHATNEGGYISWYDFACEIFRLVGYNTDVIPVSTKEYGESLAVRPLNSRLDKSKLVNRGFTPLPSWDDALKRFLANASKHER